MNVYWPFEKWFNLYVFEWKVHEDSIFKLNPLFRTMLARWYDLQRKEAGKGIKVLSVNKVLFTCTS